MISVALHLNIVLTLGMIGCPAGALAGLILFCPFVSDEENWSPKSGR